MVAMTSPRLLAAMMLAAAATASCSSNNAASTSQCPPGLVSCRGGCIDVRFDAQNCGICGTSCGKDQVCSMGKCGTSCGTGTIDCGGKCVDTRFDPAHCGGCAKACAIGLFCSNANCGLYCSGGTTECGGTCVNTKSDAAHCGGCAMPCAKGLLCQAGQCVIECLGATKVCGNKCVDTKIDPAHCGACSVACLAGQSCASGACTLPKSCYELKQASAGIADGPYPIDPDGAGGAAPVTLYCDMTTDGGGWTLVHKTNKSSAGDRTDAGFGIAALATSAVDTVAVLPRATIAKLGNSFRVITSDGKRGFWTSFAWDPGLGYYTTDNHQLPSTASFSMGLVGPHIVGRTPLFRLSWASGWTVGVQAILPAHGPCSGIGPTTSQEHLCAVRFCCGAPNAGLWLNGGAWPGDYYAGTGWVTTGHAGAGADGQAQATAGYSCKQILNDGYAVESGVFWIDPDGGSKSNAVKVHCDMLNDGGGWTRVVHIKGNSVFHADQPAAVGDVSDASQAAKLSDAAINLLSTTGYFRYNCGVATNAFVRNAERTWTSMRSNSFDWDMDRDRNGSFECKANRSGYVFSDYAACSAGHSNYAAAGGAAEGNGCYTTSEGWNLDGNLWAK